MASAKIIELDESNTCQICTNALAIYSCPKCDIIYCSLDCYRSRSHLECSESFYKQNILEELKLEEGSADSEAKMLEILKRVHEGNKIMSNESENDDLGELVDSNIDLEDLDLDSDDEPEVLDIADRLAGVNLNDAEQVWEKLTEDEKQDFVAFLKSEDVTKLIPPWEPWWLYYNDGKIEDLSESDNFKAKCPTVCDIKDFTELTKKEPAACVKYNLINILASYALTVRYFNGEYLDFVNEAVSCIVSLSLTLQNAQNFEDFEMAVKSVEQECINSNWIMTDSENIKIMREDVDKLLKGPNPTEENFYVLCALSDLHSLLDKANTSNSESNGNFGKVFPNEHFPTVKLESSSKIKNHRRKIEYFLSYAKHHYNNS